MTEAKAQLEVVTSRAWQVGSYYGPRGKQSPAVYLDVGDSRIYVFRDSRVSGPSNWIANCMYGCTWWRDSPVEAFYALETALRYDHVQLGVVLDAWPRAVQREVG